MKRVKHLVSGLTLLALAQCLGWLPPALALTPGEAEGYRGRYLEVLRSLATEGLGVATAALVHFETSVAIRHGASGLDALRELELEVATELAQSDANLLLPLIGLHERSHIEYRRRILEANPYHARATVYRQIEIVCKVRKIFVIPQDCIAQALIFYVCDQLSDKTCRC